MTDDVMWVNFWVLWGMALLCVLSYFFKKTMLVIIAIGVIAIIFYFMIYWPLTEILK